MASRGRSWQAVAGRGSSTIEQGGTVVRLITGAQIVWVAAAKGHGSRMP